jgi:hypothetical protein
MSASPSTGARLICATRAVKNARAISQRADLVLPPGTKLPDIFETIPLGVLLSLHRSDKPESLVTDPQLRKVLSGMTFPAISYKAGEPLFNGLLHFVQISFTVKANNSVVSVSNADMQTVVAYAQAVSGVISAYASQYGTASMTVSPTIVPFAVTLATNQYSDAELQQWVNQIAQNLPPGAAIAIPNPLGVVNTSGSLANGTYGYHGFAKVPYLIVNMRGSGVSVADKEQFYATNLSHEMAEMTVDPTTDGANPEVCDACGPNCQSTIIDFFKLDGTYLGSEQWPTQPAYSFDLQLNAIVRPRSSGSCPAPLDDCAYAPRGHPIAAHVPGTDILQLFARGTDAGVWSRWRNPNGSWSAEQDLGGRLTSGPIAAVIPGTNVLQLFYRGLDDGVWSRWRNPDGSWSAEQNLGG